MKVKRKRKKKKTKQKNVLKRPSQNQSKTLEDVENWVMLRVVLCCVVCYIGFNTCVACCGALCDVLRCYVIVDSD